MMAGRQTPAISCCVLLSAAVEDSRDGKYVQQENPSKCLGLALKVNRTRHPRNSPV